MRKKYLAYFVIFVLSLLAYGCGKQGGPKVLNVPVGHIVVDSVLKFKDDAQCKISIDFCYLKGKEYAAVNDSILRMGTVQPNYFAISYKPLTPEKAIPELVSRYAQEYLEMAKLLDAREGKYSRLDWALDIKTRIIAGKGEYIAYLSDITIKTGDVTNKYTLANNIDPKNGKRISLAEAFEKEPNTLTEKIMDALSEKYDIEKDQLRNKGYFKDTTPYATENCILHDDSITFIYSPGEINVEGVTVTIDL